MVNNQKIFRVSRLKDHSITSLLEKNILNEIIENSTDYQGILISDFVYGLITPNIIKTIHQ